MTINYIELKLLKHLKFKKHDKEKHNDSLKAHFILI